MEVVTQLCSDHLKTEETSPEKTLSSGIQLRTSARVSKKLKHEQETIASVNSSVDKKVDATKAEEKPPEEKRKARRPPVGWTPEDKAAFFEALNENGKNFEAIQKYMTGKAKRRGDNTAKNREQARHFYNRTYNKLSKHVKIPSSVNRVTQELYCLINFGELRKKVGKVTEKNAQKLNELIYSGSTQIRARGKTWRVKTPVCRILRKLNHFDENVDEVKLPPRVEVQLTARTNSDYSRVQSLAHNPRVKTTVPIDANLDVVLKYLEHRWKQPNEAKLRVGAPLNAQITQPSYKCGQVATSSSISLLAHEKRIGGDHESIKALLTQIQMGKSKSLLKWHKEDNVVDDYLNSDIIYPASIQQTGNQEVVQEENKEEFESRIRKGWTSETSSRLRIGELYIMLGSNGVLNLDYWFEDNDEEAKKLQLSKSLQKLIEVAKLYYFKYKVECPCGHVCRNHLKTSNIQAKKKAIPKSARESCEGGIDLGTKLLTTSTTTNLTAVVTSGHVAAAGTATVVFKQPLLPAPNSAPTNMTEAYKALQPFRPKYCNRRGRSKTRHKGVVVQRMLPLLPKTIVQPPSAPVVVAVQVIPQTTQGQEMIPTTEAEEVKVNSNPEGSFPQSLKEQPPVTVPTFTEDEPTPSLGLLSLSLPSNDICLPSTSTTSFTGILGTDASLEVTSTPPTSPSRILKEGESQWLNAEVTDFSLSSFLGHLESPLKPALGPNGAQQSEDSRLSAEVDSQFHCLMTESSLDYTAKFADLAAKISESSNVKFT